MDVRAIGKRHHRIEENVKVGTATHALDGVIGRRIAAIKMRGRGAGQVPASREADDADAVGIESPRGGVRTDITNRALGIVDFSRW